MAVIVTSEPEGIDAAAERVTSNGGDQANDPQGAMFALVVPRR